MVPLAGPAAKTMTWESKPCHGKHPVPLRFLHRGIYSVAQNIAATGVLPQRLLASGRHGDLGGNQTRGMEEGGINLSDASTYQFS